MKPHPPAPQVQAPQSNDPKCKFCGVPQSQLPWPICTDEVECDPDDDGVQVQAEGESP